MPKFLLNLLLQISKALVNSKIQFLIQKFFSLLSARPTLRPLAPPAHRPRCLRSPSRPRVGRVFTENTFSLSDHAFPSRPPLPRLNVNRAPPVRFTPFPALADPGQKFLAPPLPRAAARASDAPELLQPSLITLPPLIPFKPSLNEP
jgi:hypothetical protein